MNGSQTAERFFEWGSLPPAWVIFLLVVPLVVFVVGFFYRRERPVGSAPARWILGGLRAAAILAVLAILAQPFIREIFFQTRDAQVVILVDDSLSMKIQDRYADRSIPQGIAEVFRMSPESVERESRYDLVGRLLRDREINFVGQIRERAGVSLWTFAAGLRKIRDLDRAAAGAAAGEEAVLPEMEKIQGEDRLKQTRIGDCLVEALAGTSGSLSSRQSSEIAAVVLFSDGQQNAGTLPPEEAARRLGQRGVSVFAVGVGNPAPPRDVRVVAVESSDVLLVGDRAPFEAAVVSEGFEGERVRVELLFDGEVADTEYLTLEGGGRRQSVRLEHVPRAPGDPVAVVKVEYSPSEVFEENNVFSKQVKVLDQKIKVLYLEGRPRWEYHFLKNALIRDPTMEAQAILYSADKEFIQESSPGVPPLRAFPAAREVFFQYHVVIVGDVEPEHLRPEEMEILKEFVSEAGGGVVFIAGFNANPARYLHTPLYTLLPVEVPDRGRGLEEEVRGNPFNVRLTGVGREHAAMRIDSDPERNRILWENDDGIEERHLPSFHADFANVTREKIGAVKLGTHPDERLQHPVYGPRVIFAFQNLGRGRTFFSGVDTTWRWRAGVDNLYFYKFWGQVIRFAASGRLLGKTPRYSITTDKLVYTLGEKATIDARVYDANMKPATDEAVRIFHQVESVSEGGLKPPQAILLALNKVKGPGSYEGVITADNLGRHELWLGTETEKLKTRNFTVEVPALEFRETRMDRERLKRIAEASGGKYHDLHEIASVVQELSGITKPRQTPIDDQQTDLWDNLWVLVLLTGLLAGEWIYRKMVKLL